MGRIPRRDALKQMGLAGAAALLPGGVIRGQTTPIVVAGKPVEISVASITPSTVRITVLPLDGGMLPDDGALVSAAAGRPAGRGRAAERFAPVRAGDLTVRLTADPPVLHVERKDGSVVQKLTLDRASAAMSFLLPKGPLLGFGEGGPQFDRKGSTDRMRNGQGGYQLRTHGGRVPIQYLIGTDGWGLYIHQPVLTSRPSPQGTPPAPPVFDFTGAEGRMLPVGEVAPLDLFVTASPDPKTILGDFARITGFAELPALWTFGYMQSHRTLAGPDEVMGVARTFREKQLPCDALIYLGTEFTPSGWNTRNGEFGWKPENFPAPEKMIEQLHGQHFKVVLHIVIEGRRMSGSVSDPCTPDKAVPSGRTSDNRWPEDRAVPCYWPYHKPLMDIGVDGWWPDQGDGLDAPSRLARIRMYWEGPQQYRPNERPFALHRNGYVGMQRYGAFLWSGDVYSTWETLKTHVPVAVNTGLSGIPFWGTDIGGFVPTPEYTGELHVRWFQFGTFCPSFRAHGRTWHLRLPWGWNTGQLGHEELRGYTGGAGHPDPGELRNPRVEPIVKKYLELRYRMLPYTYTAAKETTETGLPMIRALWLHYPDDAAAAARGDQFLWGRDLLVSPVVEKGATARRLYLPRGAWFDFWTEERLAGGREIDRAVDLETIPLHVRAGAVLPFGPVKQYVEHQVEAPLTLVVYPGADGASMLYEDDGKSFDHRQGEAMRMEIGWRDRDRRLTLRLARGSRMLPPAPRRIVARVAGSQSLSNLTFDGKPLEVKL
ncbi:MAG TPA: TIM-barrel domain-containing protein [Vicinamibacterales bacterium]|nr:TIM-barrel domain-containing protein [Vicinamibacterales bacterium]